MAFCDALFGHASVGGKLKVTGSEDGATFAVRVVPRASKDVRGAIQFAAEKAAEEGRQEGRREQAIATAREMLAKGYDVAEIAELTGLAPAEIAALAER